MKNNRYMYCVAMALALNGLGGCALTNNGMPLAQMTFEHIKPYPVYVASYEAVPLAHKTNLPQGFVADPGVLISDYFKNRFQASGHQGKLKSVIEHVSVAYGVENSDHKVGNFLGLGKREHYRVDAAVKLELLGGKDHDMSEVRLKAYRDIYISEHVSIVEREKAQMEGLDKLIDDLDIAVRDVISRQFKLLGQK